MELSLEQALIEVWRQALAENAKVVVLGKERYTVRRTPKRGLRQVGFILDGHQIRGLDQRLNESALERISDSLRRLNRSLGQR
jgi:hypothetical protein